MYRGDDAVSSKRRALVRAGSTVTSDSGMSSQSSAQETSTEGVRVVPRNSFDWPPPTTCGICLCEEIDSMDEHLRHAHPNDVFFFSKGENRAVCQVQAAIEESIRRFRETNDRIEASFSYPSESRRCGYQCSGCDRHYYREEVLTTHRKRCKKPFRVYCRYCDVYFENENRFADHARANNKARKKSDGYYICTPPDSTHIQISAKVEYDMAISAKRKFQPNSGYNAAWWTESKNAEAAESVPFDVYAFGNSGGGSGEADHSGNTSTNVRVRGDLLSPLVQSPPEDVEVLSWHRPPPEKPQEAIATPTTIPTEMAPYDPTVTRDGCGIVTTAITSARLKDPRLAPKPCPPPKPAQTRIWTWSAKNAPNPLETTGHAHNRRLRLFPLDMIKVLKCGPGSPSET